MYAMAIGGVDVVLGSQWLATIGTMGINLQKQFLRFFEKGIKYKFFGIKSPTPQLVSSNRMEKMIKKGSQAYLLHCHSMEGSFNNMDDPKGLEEILGKYSTIFQDLPRGLPPTCLEITS
jgi:hypothetical protein